LQLNFTKNLVEEPYFPHIFSYSFNNFIHPRGKCASMEFS
jgi:hypothetical protein